MNLQETLTKRYTVKKFDVTKTISEDKIEQLKDLLRMAPSSVNIQPWHFTLISSMAGKEKVAKATENFGFNTEKMLGAPLIVVFSAKTMLSSDELQALTTQEDQDGRFPKEEYKTEWHNGREYFYKLHQDTLGDVKEWLAKQTYLNVGHFALGTTILGLDSVIMEGFDSQILGEELELTKDNYEPVVVIGIGYRATDDFNAALPKSRLSKETIITEIK